MTESACKKIINKLKKKKVYNAHHVLFSTTKKKDFNHVKNKYVNASYEYNDIFAIPELTKAIVDENKILEVKNYFGCIPTVNTILLTWTFDKYNHDYGTQIFHRDCDDYRQCNMITLLTETKQNNGGHELYLRTHDKKNVDKSFRKINKENNYKKKQPINFFNMPIGNITGYGNNDIYKIFFSEQKKELYGKAGSSFLTDAYALHRGVRPRKKARLMLWVSYGLLSEASNSSRNFLGKHKGVVINKTILKRISYKKISHVVKSTDLIRYAFRNIIDFSNAN